MTASIGRITLNERNTRLLESALQMGLISILESLTNSKGELEDLSHLGVVMKELKKENLTPKDIKIFIDKLKKRGSQPLTENHRQMVETVDSFEKTLQSFAYKLEMDAKMVRRLARQIENETYI